jgi:hypothetical protein
MRRAAVVILGVGVLIGWSAGPAGADDWSKAHRRPHPRAFRPVHHARTHFFFGFNFGVPVYPRVYVPYPYYYYPYPVYSYPVYPAPPPAYPPPAPAYPSAPALNSYLRLDVSPGEVEMWVNGRYLGRSRDFGGSTLVPVSPGDHLVQFRLGGYATSRTVRVAAGETVQVWQDLASAAPPAEPRAPAAPPAPPAPPAPSSPPTTPQY